VSTPPRHVQAVSCVVATPYHILTGSDDSDIHVWSLSQLLELDSTAEHEPERTLSNHRASITSLSVSPSISPDTNLCVSSSKDKSVVVWNYQTGDALRTLLFPSTPLCLSLDPSTRAVCVACGDSSIFLAAFFTDPPLLGPQSEDATTVVQVNSPFGVAPTDVGAANCLAFSYDGTILLTGHSRGQILRWEVSDANKTPVELTNLNASVSNLIFTPPFPASQATRVVNIVKPSQAERAYVLTAQFDGYVDVPSKSRFDTLLDTPGFSHDTLTSALATLEQPAAESAGDEELRRQNEELWEIIKQQRALQKHTIERYIEAKSGLS